MNIKKKLTNPFALVAQGFGLGAIFFFVTATFQPESPQPVQAAAATIVSDA